MAHGFKEIRQQGNSSPNVKGGCCGKKTSSVTAKSASDRSGKGGVGSRRMFSTAFKLQVLDSYRTDADCRGNQRATARKYGIHRRQIQKWLQMESNLRCSAMATENGNGVSNGSSEAVALNLAAQARQRDGTCAAGCLPNSAGSKVKNSAPAENPLKPDSPSNYLSQMTTPPATDDDDDEELNVDGISDSEDESSGGESIFEQDQALDFTCAALSRRRFYSLEFKLSVLDVFHNECFRNQRATALKFGIHRRQVQKWLNQENLLRAEYASTTSKISSIPLATSPTSSIREPSPISFIREAPSPCLDLTRKRKMDDDIGEFTAKKSYIDLDSKHPLCLVKSYDLPYTPTPSCTPPYTDVLPCSASPTSPYWAPTSTSCCGNLTPPPFYECWTSAGPYACPYACITSRLHQDAVYYKQAVKDINLYAPTVLYS